MNTFRETFKELSDIDVNEYTEKKGEFTYLSWSWAWKILVENTESASYVWNEDKVFTDGSMEVSCDLTVNGYTLPMWGAVTDYTAKKSLIKPDSHSINTARMRCLVKAMAMFGLGHYIYTGESFPENIGTPAPASDASPGDDADTTLGSQVIQNPTYKTVLKSIIPCGVSKGKTYQDIYVNDLGALLKAGKTYAAYNKPSIDQDQHLTNLRVIQKHHRQNNSGVLA